MFYSNDRALKVLIISINVDYIYVNKFNRYGDGLLLIEAKPVAIQAMYDNAIDMLY
jgi:hypothetical protein